MLFVTLAPLKRQVRFTVEKDGAFLVFSNVDADVCDNCGEAYFNEAAAIKFPAKAEEEFKEGKEIKLVKL